MYEAAVSLRIPAFAEDMQTAGVDVECAAFTAMVHNFYSGGPA